MFLEELLNNTVFENGEIECKQILNKDNIEGWIKTIAGFANASGGTMYIGVDDKTNKLIGFTVRDKERFIIAVTVGKSPVRSVIVKFKNAPAIYMRREGFTLIFIFLYSTDKIFTLFEI